MLDRLVFNFCLNYKSRYLLDKSGNLTSHPLRRQSPYPGTVSVLETSNVEKSYILHYQTSLDRGNVSRFGDKRHRFEGHSPFLHYRLVSRVTGQKSILEIQVTRTTLTSDLKVRVVLVTYISNIDYLEAGNQPIMQYWSILPIGRQYEKWYI